jgi:hypothetical protein
LDTPDVCNDSAELFDFLKNTLLGQFGKSKWQSYFELLRLPMEMMGLKPSVLMGKLKQHLPPGVSPDNDLFLSMFFIHLPRSMRETVGAGTFGSAANPTHTTATAMHFPANAGLIFLTDELTNDRYLVDTGATRSIVPCSQNSNPSGPFLKGADGQPIPLGVSFKKLFIIVLFCLTPSIPALVPIPLANVTTSSQPPAVSAYLVWNPKVKSSSVSSRENQSLLDPPPSYKKFPDFVPDDVKTLLQKILSILRTGDVKLTLNHGVEHHIHTGSHPHIFAKSCCLDP